jgi:hypothetical protein
LLFFSKSCERTILPLLLSTPFTTSQCPPAAEVWPLPRAPSLISSREWEMRSFAVVVRVL